MDQDAIIRYISDTFAGVDVVRPETSGGPEIAFGDTFLIYDPDRNLDVKQRFPFTTIVTKDYPGEPASLLNRPSVFRLNIGLSRETYISLFGPTPAADVAANRHDFSALDQLMPHPVYHRMHWVCVLNPSASTFESLRPLLAEAYDLAVKRASRVHPVADS